MDWQFAAVLVICLITEQIEKLGVDHGDQEVKGTVRIAHDEKQRRFPVTQLVQFQLIVHGRIPDFLDVKGRKAGTAGNQDGFCGLAGSQFIELVLPPCKAVRLLFCQIFKEQINRILIILVVLGHLHGVEHFQQRSKILLLSWGFVVQIGNQRCQ